MKEEERGERQRGLFPIRHCGEEREMREPTVYHQTMTRQDRTKSEEGAEARKISGGVSLSLSDRCGEKG